MVGWGRGEGGKKGFFLAASGYTSAVTLAVLAVIMVTEYGGNKISRSDGEVCPTCTRTGVVLDAHANAEPAASGEVMTMYLDAVADGAPPPLGVYGNAVGDRLTTVVLPGTMPSPPLPSLLPLKCHPSNEG